MEYVYLVIASYETRTEVRSVAKREKVEELYSFMDNTKPGNYIREKLGAFNTKYYTVDAEGNKVFQEQLFVQKLPLMG